MNASGRACANCRHFGNAPRAVERAFPGLSALGSGWADVRGGDGICSRHGRYLSLRSCCDEHEPVTREAADSPVRSSTLRDFP